jgi:hypothetical protein
VSNDQSQIICFSIQYPNKHLLETSRLRNLNGRTVLGQAGGLRTSNQVTAVQSEAYQSASVGLRRLLTDRSLVEIFSGPNSGDRTRGTVRFSRPARSRRCCEIAALFLVAYSSVLDPVKAQVEYCGMPHA